MKDLTGLMFFAVSTGALLLNVGCSGPGGVAPRPTNPTSGSVTYQGEPLVDGTVTLHPMSPPEDGQPLVTPRGTVGEDGTFRLTTYSINDGAPAGDYRVAFRWQGSLEGISEDEEAELPELLPEQYLNPETSGFTVTITKGENKPPPFELN